MARKRHNYKDIFEPVKTEDVRHIAENMREEDIAELKAAHGNVSPRAVLLQALTSTPDPYTIVAPDGSGEPIALIGTKPPPLLGNGKATPWMLGTERVKEFPRTFLVGGRDYVRDMLERFGRLENHVDVRNTVSVNWLRSIGFTLDEPAPHGFAKLPFHRFYAEVYMVDAEKGNMNVNEKAD